MYLLTEDGQVMSLTKKLHLKWSHSLGAASPVGGLAIGNDGSLYAGGTGTLHRIRQP